MPGEIFASNLPTTTVTSGGTAATSGTQTWTVASSSLFPVASSSLELPTQFHVADALSSAASEIIAVTNVSGTTWTVTRGAEGTTPVSHAAGFTVYQVLTSGGMAAFSQSPYNLNNYGADPTGTSFSDTALGNIMTAMGSKPGTVTCSIPGTYKFANSYSFGPGQGISTGFPTLSVIFSYTGNSAFIFSGDPAFNTSNSSPLASICGPMNGFTIDGASAGSSAVLFQYGDQNLVNINIGVQNATGASAIGALLKPKIGWINYGSVIISSNNCTQHAVFDGSAVGGTAIGGVDFKLYQTASANQNGVVLKGTCQLQGGTFELFGEYLGGSGTNTGSVISIGADSTSCSILNFSEFNVNAESATGAGNTGHVSVAIGSSSAFLGCAGQMEFRNPSSASFQVSTGTNANLTSFSFFGFVYAQTSGDVLGNPYSGVGTIGWATTARGGQLEAVGVVDSSSFYPSSGSVFDLTLSSGSNTRTIYGSAPTYGQKLTLFLTAGTTSTLTITGVLTPSGSGLIGPTSVTSGYVDIVELRYNGTNWAQSSVTLHVHLFFEVPGREDDPVIT